MKRTKKQTIPRLRDAVWTLFSKYIRLRDAQCFTCGAPVPIKKAHAGHFLHGKNKATYLMEENVHTQCVKCNLFLSGNMVEYYPRLQKLIGEERVQELKDIHAKEHIWKRDELEALKDKYKQLVKESDKI